MGMDWKGSGDIMNCISNAKNPAAGQSCFSAVAKPSASIQQSFVCAVCKYARLSIFFLLLCNHLLCHLRSENASRGT